MNLVAALEQTGTPAGLIDGISEIGNAPPKGWFGVDAGTRVGDVEFARGSQTKRSF